MQTKLRILGFVVVGSLLWISPTSATTQRVKTENKAKASKIKYLGTASWYGRQHQGRTMANGKRFDRNQFTAASWSFPLGTVVRVVNINNGDSVMVTITDRGPNLRLHRILDLSEAAAGQLEYVGMGLTKVFLYPMATFQTESAGFEGQLAEFSEPRDQAQYLATALTSGL